MRVLPSRAARGIHPLVTCRRSQRQLESCLFIFVGGSVPTVKVGDLAPDFELPAVVGDKRSMFKLSDLRGQNVVLAFYVLNWTPT